MNVKVADVLPDLKTFKKMIESSDVRQPINATCHQEGKVLSRDPEVSAGFARELHDAAQLSA